MGRDALVRAATEYAKKEGWNVSEYTASDVQAKGKDCSVSFAGKSKRPGDHFTVYLDCKSGAVVRLMPGR
jgi:hypothetical protein